TSPRMSMAILKGRISERGAFLVAWSGFILALIMGIFLTLHRGWPIVLLGLIGFIGGYFYTAPPFQYKYRALGLPLVFLLMGPQWWSARATPSPAPLMPVCSSSRFRSASW